MKAVFQLGKELAKLFLATGADIVTFITDIEGREVKVTVTFLPKN